MNFNVVGFVSLYRRLYILNLDLYRALIKNAVLQTREFSYTNLWRMSLPRFCCCVPWLGPTTQRSHWCHSHFLPPTTPDFTVLKRAKMNSVKVNYFFIFYENWGQRNHRCVKNFELLFNRSVDPGLTVWILRFRFFFLSTLFRMFRLHLLTS
jgi:hypothetical protein